MSFPRMLKTLFHKQINKKSSYKEFSPIMLSSPEDPKPHCTFADCTHGFMNRLHMRRDKFTSSGGKSSRHSGFKLVPDYEFLLIDLLTGALFKVLKSACIISTISLKFWDNSTNGEWSFILVGWDIPSQSSLEP